MNSKEVALCSVFTAIAISLGDVRIPTITGLPLFYFWEIPIVIALLLFGFKIGFTITALTACGQALIFPRALGVIFPIWNFIAMLTGIVGVYLGYKLVKWRASRNPQVNIAEIKPARYFLSLSIVFRLAFMPFVDFFMYKFLMPIFGPSFSDAYIMGLMPGLLVFDLILVLYTVPTSYAIAKIVNRNLNLGNQIC
jgi:riboflavin transporter FmnP